MGSASNEGSLPIYRGSHQHDVAPAERLTREPPPRYPAAMINVTNRCNLTCSHCFLYVDGNPAKADDQMGDEELLAELRRIRDRHGLRWMLWMGGEPMIRWRLLGRGVELFERNIITTNGSIPLKDFGPTVGYVISLDGPEDLNDRVRGDGVFARALRNVNAVPADFSPTIQVQCVVTKENQHRLAELVEALAPSRVQGLTFSFYCPQYGEDSAWSWRDAEEREVAVDAVLALKAKHPRFIWNKRRSLELLRARTARLVTDNCPAVRTVMPLYVQDGRFVTPRCCHGNEVDCDRCGSWVVFHHAAKLAGPWDDLLPGAAPDPLLEAYVGPTMNSRS